MSISTDLMYNAASRYIHVMYRIHFSSTSILEVDKTNYLVSSSFLEESYKLSDLPFGDVTSNEITFTLFNHDGMFNPNNVSSEYYGRIKKGVKVEAFIRLDEVTEWDPFGVYYVTQWYTSSNGTTAEVTANDILYNILNGSIPPMPVYRGIAFKDFIDIYFNHFDLQVKVDETITDVIPYVYTSEHSNNKAFLTDLMKSVLADCFCDHTGQIVIMSKVRKRNVRATLTDNDQIIGITIKQTIATSYDSSVINYNKCRESAELPLVELSDIQVEPGFNSTGNLTLSKHPILSIRSIKITGSSSAKMTTFGATAKDFVGTIQSTNTVKVNMDVIGTILDKVSIAIGDSKEAPMEISGEFIQDETKASSIQEYVDAYIMANMPTLEVAVRGNPKLQLGDLIEITSERYKTNYVGIIIKASYEYAGHLTSNLTLVDASDLKEV